MNKKNKQNNFRIKFSPSSFFAVGFFVFLFASSASAQTYSSNDLLNAYKGYVAESVPSPLQGEGGGEVDSRLAINASDLQNAFRNYVRDVPVAPPEPAFIQPPSSPLSGGENASLDKERSGEVVFVSGDVLNAFKNYIRDVTPAQEPPVSASTKADPAQTQAQAPKTEPAYFGSSLSANALDASLADALRNLLKNKEFASQLRGPQGPAGPAGATGPAGTPTTNAMYPGQPVASLTPSAPALIPQVFMPVGIIQPSPSHTNNFNGAIFAGATNVSSNHISSGSATITELTVRENTTIGGTLVVTGTVTVPSVTITTGIVDSMTIGGGYGTTGVTISNTGNIQANGTLIIDGTSTLTGATAIAGETTIGGGYASTGVTVSTAGNIQAAGALTIDGAATIGTGTSLTNTFGSGASSINTIGSATTPGALTLHGAATLDNTFSQTGANTFSTGTGAVSLNGDTTIASGKNFHKLEPELSAREQVRSV